LESKLLFALEELEASVFSFDEAKKAMEISSDSLKNVIYRLKKKKRVIEIKRGKYLFVPARAGPEGNWSEYTFRALPKLLGENYYVGFWTALNYWGMTEQHPLVCFVATTKRAKDFEFSNQKIKFVTVSGKKFFGFEKQKAKGADFNVSGREKTIIDCLLFPQHCGGISEAAKGLWNARKEINWEKLVEYAEKAGVGAASRRLGFILEELKLRKDIQKKLWKDFVGFAWADPSSGKKEFRYNKKWGLKVNIGEKELTGWMES
jgi:predicted transcriptional regulator of viral defense system